MSWRHIAIASAIVWSVSGVSAYAQQAQPPVQGIPRPGVTGPCMLGTWLMGPEVMDGLGPIAIERLDLDANQRAQVLQIEDDLRRKNRDLMGKLQDEAAKIRDGLWANGKRDRSAVLAANRQMSKIQRHMLENIMNSADKVEALLSPRQREELRRIGPWWQCGGER